MLRTLYNGWCTHRRFQKRHYYNNTCLLGCGGNSEDSIEHYCRCRVTTALYNRLLNVHVPNSQLLDFFMLHCSGSAKDLMCSSLCVYGIYNTLCINMHIGIADNEVSYDRAKQCIIRAARGHTGVQQFLDSRWSNDSLRQNAPVPG